MGEPPLRPSRLAALWDLLVVFLRLGLTSFGGPVAHLGYYREVFVTRRRWLDEGQFADLVALCQFLPGPASSQVGIAVGAMRAGPLGGVLAWLAFTLPSALFMIAFAYGVTGLGEAVPAGLLQGLRIVAVAVVAQAVWGMGRTLCPDRPRATLALLAAMGVLLWRGPGGQIAVIALGGLAGWRLFPGPSASASPSPSGGGIGRKGGAALLLVFFALLAGLPVIAAAAPEALRMPAALLERFFRAGALVFGGGHVVLPLLQAGVVPPAWVSEDAFMAGYGAAQAVPGPLFSFAAYLGTAIGRGMAAPPWLVGLYCLGAIFLPSFLLLYGVLPFWERLRGLPAAQAALRGVNAAVVGILLAALYDPVWTTGIRAPAHLVLALAAYALLAFWKAPPWLVVVLSGLAGALLL
jgi:chromate transporter